MENDSGEKYSDQSFISAYVPQVRARGFPHALLACDISDINPDHIKWKDPIRGHGYYCMTQDIDFLRKTKKEHPVLSMIRYYGPHKVVPPSSNTTSGSGGGYGSTAL